MLRVEGLTVAASGPALSFDAPAGQCTGLLGSDAAVLLRFSEAICGIRAPIAGRVLVGGADILSDNRARSQLSVCLARATNRFTNIREHVAAVVAARGSLRLPAADGMSRLGVDPRARLDTSAARSAAALLAALIPAANVAVLHEPFAGMDTNVRQNAIDWIRSLSGTPAAIVIIGGEERDVRAVSHSVVSVGAGR